VGDRPGLDVHALLGPWRVDGVAALAAQARTAPAPVARAMIGVLERERAQRLEYWAALASARTPAGARIIRGLLRGLGLSRRWPVLTAPVLIALAAALAVNWTIFAVACVLLLVLAVALQEAEQPAQDALRRLREHACPDCGYSLDFSALPADPARAALGPPACPECGLAWPGVPPPVVVEGRAEVRLEPFGWKEPEGTRD
jgi:hypothetical protein